MQGDAQMQRPAGPTSPLVRAAHPHVGDALNVAEVLGHILRLQLLGLVSLAARCFVDLPRWLVVSLARRLAQREGQLVVGPPAPRPLIVFVFGVAEGRCLQVVLSCTAAMQRQQQQQQPAAVSKPVAGGQQQAGIAGGGGGGQAGGGRAAPARGRAAAAAARRRQISAHGHRSHDRSQLQWQRLALHAFVATNSDS